MNRSVLTVPFQQPSIRFGLQQQSLFDLAGGERLVRFEGTQRELHALMPDALKQLRHLSLRILPAEQSPQMKSFQKHCEDTPNETQEKLRTALEEDIFLRDKQVNIPHLCITHVPDDQRFYNINFYLRGIVYWITSPDPIRDLRPAFGILATSKP